MLNTSLFVCKCSLYMKSSGLHELNMGSVDCTNHPCPSLLPLLLKVLSTLKVFKVFKVIKDRNAYQLLAPFAPSSTFSSLYHLSFNFFYLPLTSLTP